MFDSTHFMTQNDTAQNVPVVDLRQKARKSTDYKFEEVTIRVEQPSLGRLSEIASAQKRLEEVDESDQDASFNALFEMIKLMSPTVTKAQVRKLTLQEVKILMDEIMDSMHGNAREGAKKK